MKKKIIFTVVAVILCGVIVFSGCSDEKDIPEKTYTSDTSGGSETSDNSEVSIDFENIKLSELPEEQCRQYLTIAGIELTDKDDINGIQKYTIAEFEKDPNWSGTIASSFNTRLWDEAFRTVVKMYYWEPKFDKGTILSKLDDDECKKLLTDLGVDIPNEYNITVVKDLLALFENNSNFSSVSTDNDYFISVNLPFYNSLQIIVNVYYFKCYEQTSD